MRLSELQSKQLISTEDGKNIGSIIDCNVNREGLIEELVVETKKGMLSRLNNSEFVVKWSEITKIGEDVILVKK